MHLENKVAPSDLQGTCWCLQLSFTNAVLFLASSTPSSLHYKFTFSFPASWVAHSGAQWVKFGSDTRPSLKGFFQEPWYRSTWSNNSCICIATNPAPHRCCQVLLQLEIQLCSLGPQLPQPSSVLAAEPEKEGLSWPCERKVLMGYSLLKGLFFS